MNTLRLLWAAWRTDEPHRFEVILRDPKMRRNLRVASIWIMAAVSFLIAGIVAISIEGCASTASAQTPGFTVEPHPAGLRVSGTAPGGAVVNEIELRARGWNSPSGRIPTIPWNPLRGTAVFELDETELPDGSNLQIWISQWINDGTRRTWRGSVTTNPHTLTYNRPGALDVRGVQDDVMWPGADFVRIFADQGGVPANVVWVMIGFGLAFVALVGVGGATQSPVVGGIAGGVVLGLITTPTIGIASIGLLLIYAMTVVGVSVVWK